MENRVKQARADAGALSVSLRLGGLYDTRVGATSSRDVNDREAGSAFLASGSVGWQFPVKDKFSLRADYNAYADFHKDDEEFNVIDQSVSVEPQYFSGNFIFSLPLAGNYVLEDKKTDYIRYNLTPTVTYLLPNITHAVALYGLASVIDDRDDYPPDEDGIAWGGGCGYIIFFRNLSKVRFSVDYQHTTYDAAVMDYGTPSLSADDREDGILAFNADMQYQFTPHIGIYTSYSYFHAHSNVNLYDYDRGIIEGGLALRF